MARRRKRLLWGQDTNSQCLWTLASVSNTVLDARPRLHRFNSFGERRNVQEYFHTVVTTDKAEATISIEELHLASRHVAPLPLGIIRFRSSCHSNVPASLMRYMLSAPNEYGAGNIELLNACRSAQRSGDPHVVPFHCFAYVRQLRCRYRPDCRPWCASTCHIPGHYFDVGDRPVGLALRLSSFGNILFRGRGRLCRFAGLFRDGSRFFGC
ncbi:Uncharacterised protein [Chlamydia trachomatis]|nr:Uncharacterised protein [Chlamydia trachomatis]